MSCGCLWHFSIDTLLAFIFISLGVFRVTVIKASLVFKFIVSFDVIFDSLDVPSSKPFSFRLDFNISPPEVPSVPT
ncbi:hypothetical protein CCAL13119_05195 [Campylobacter sp. RM13119]|uniref:hypothetical protein n=1 Tax=Campylobacter TaxID=194 RepID=UPI00147295F6|nr:MULTISPECIES: hypothetical protein [unclassified Campylobacter]MBE3606356.1 hypothetical protein [Campylobacter sp. RM13119]